MERYSALIGRILLAAIFLMSGLNKITGFEGTMGYMESQGMTTATSFFLVCAIVLEVAGGLSLVLGFKTRLGAVLLIVFLIPASLIFHTEFSDQNQVVHLLKNLAILGGLFMVLAHGAGPLSLDGRRRD